jgi:uncharacterized protein YjbI with pentapeptide repeats
MQQNVSQLEINNSTQTSAAKLGDTQNSTSSSPVNNKVILKVSDEYFETTEAVLRSPFGGETNFLRLLIDGTVPVAREASTGAIILNDRFSSIMEFILHFLEFGVLKMHRRTTSVILALMEDADFYQLPLLKLAAISKISQMNDISIQSVRDSVSNSVDVAKLVEAFSVVDDKDSETLTKQNSYIAPSFSCALLSAISLYDLAFQRGVDMRDACLALTRFIRCSFTGSESYLFYAQNSPPYSGVALRNAPKIFSDFSGSYFILTTWMDCGLNNIKMHGADFSLSKFMSCTFVNCDVKDCGFDEVCFDQSPSQAATNTNAICSFTGCSFASSSFLQVKWVNGKFSKTNFSGCDLREADLTGATFDSCNFESCNLSRTNFSNTTLTNCMYADSTPLSVSHNPS